MKVKTPIPAPPSRSLCMSGARFVSEQGQRLLDRAWPLLETAVETLGRTSLATHVERTWRSLGGDVALSADRRNNVQRYLQVLREVETEADRVDLGVLEAPPEQAVCRAGVGVHRLTEDCRSSC